MTPLERITERVMRLGDPNDPATPSPLLTIAEFFDGNDAVGSIGCNLPGAPTPALMRQLFEGIAARSDVKDVRVVVTLFDEPDYWPFSDTVIVMTTAEPEEVRGWFPERLAPNEVYVGDIDSKSFEPYDLPPGTRAIGCWWD